ncbi:MAG: hypothetical protein KKC54_07575 [Nanoarchaeota archaeon]|nr:hypothetical protein [Nanoarchaeota archaeon]
MRNNKRAQVTIFIIMGIIVLIGALLYFGIKTETITSEIFPNMGITVQEVPVEFQPVNVFIEECVSQIAEEGIRKIGERGGFIEPKRYGIITVSKPTESDSVRMSPGSDYSVPYWYYMKSPNECAGQCDYIEVPDNMLYLYKKDGFPSIEGQLEECITANLGQCLADFKVLKDQGFDVNVLGQLKSKVSIRDNDISISVEYPLEFSRAGSKKISDFTAVLPLNIKNIYDLAKEVVDMQADYRYLEKDLLNLIVGFSGVDSSMLPPMQETIFQFGSETRWPVQKVKMDIENVLSSYIQLLQVSSTQNYEPRDRGNSLSSSLYNTGMLIPVSGNYPELKISFMANPEWWPIYFKMNCKGTCRPESASSNLMALIGIQRYSFVYDISYPALVTINDPDALNYKGYSFNFFMESNIRQNEPMPPNYIPAPLIDSGASMFCDEEKRNSGDITIEVKDADDYRLDNIEVIYTCSGTSCSMGKTEDGLLVSKFPSCLGGVVSVVKDGYLGQSKPLDIDENSHDSISFKLNPIIIKRFIVKKKLIEKRGKYWIPTMKIVDLEPNEQAVISLEKADDITEEDFQSSASYNGNMTEPAEIRVGAGKFAVNINLLIDESIKIPASKIKDQDVPEQILPQPFRSGGLTANYTFSSYNLKNSNVITFYALSYDIYNVPESERKLSDLTEVMDMEKASKLYWYGAWPKYG